MDLLRRRGLDGATDKAQGDYLGLCTYCGGARLGTMAQCNAVDGTGRQGVVSGGEPRESDAGLLG